MRSGDTTFGSCVPKIAQDVYGCQQIIYSIMSSGSQFSDIDTENARCGIEYCDSDLCNFPRTIPMSTGAPVAALNDSKLN